jgi:nucleoside 2-deoxyribosyltransferase
MNKKYAYLAGPIFTRAQQEWTLGLRNQIESEFLDLKLPLGLIWPYEDTPKNTDEPNVSHKLSEVLRICVDGLDRADLLLAILDGATVDDGTAWEMGYFFSRHRGVRPIIGLRTDARSSGDIDGGVVNSLIQASCNSIAANTQAFIAAIANHCISL